MTNPIVRDTGTGAHAIRAALTHPVAMAVKGALRDLRWNLQGPRFHSQPLPDRVESVLFVCLGNICRSPFAERLARRRHAPFQAASAGIKVSADGRSPELAGAAAARFGVSLSDHRPQPLSAALIGAHDLVVVMEPAQEAAVLSVCRAPIALLPLFDESISGGFERWNIADPFGRPLETYEHCYRHIDRAVSGLIAALGEASRPSVEAGDGPA